MAPDSPEKRPPTEDAADQDYELFRRDVAARARAIVPARNPLWEPPRPDPRRDSPEPARRQPPDGGRKGRPE